MYFVVFLQDKNDLRGLVDMKTALDVNTYAMNQPRFSSRFYTLFTRPA